MANTTHPTPTDTETIQWALAELAETTRLFALKVRDGLMDLEFLAAWLPDFADTWLARLRDFDGGEQAADALAPLVADFRTSVTSLATLAKAAGSIIRTSRQLAAA